MWEVSNQTKKGKYVFKKINSINIFASQDEANRCGGKWIVRLRKGYKDDINE